MMKRLAIAVVVIAALSALGFYFYPTLSRQSPGKPGQHTVILIWNAPARATSYNIFRRAYDTDTLAKIGTSNKTSYFDSTAQPDSDTPTRSALWTPKAARARKHRKFGPPFHSCDNLFHCVGSLLVAAKPVDTAAARRYFPTAFFRPLLPAIPHGARENPRTLEKLNFKENLS